MTLPHQWLFLHPLESVATIRRLVTFYVDEHNHVLPHSAFRGQTPDDVLGGGDAVPPDLTLRAPRAEHAWQPTDRHRARRARLSTRPRDSRPADRHYNHRPLVGVRLASCPRLRRSGWDGPVFLKTGTRDGRANRTVRVHREDAAEPSLGSAPPLLLHWVARTRAEGQNVRKDSWEKSDEKKDGYCDSRFRR